MSDTPAVALANIYGNSVCCRTELLGVSGV
jgi:hypothetical protein